MMPTLPRALTTSLAAAAMLAAGAVPAQAQSRHHHDGISAGEVIAGAVVIGGLAAIIASANSRNRYDDRYDYRDGRGGYGPGSFGARAAVEQCVREAERRAMRRTGSRAEVYEIREIDRRRDGFEVKGRIAVQDNFRGRSYRDAYRRGQHASGWDEGRFICDTRHGRVARVEYRGIRGL